jgi:hypothetical protein
MKIFKKPAIYRYLSMFFAKISFFLAFNKLQGLLRTKNTVFEASPNIP